MLKNGKSWYSFFKSFKVHALIFSLLVTSPATYGVSTFQSGLEYITNTILQSNQQMLAQRQQLNQQAAIQQQIATLQPQPVPSKYFPQCRVIPAVTDFPSNACQVDIPFGDQASLYQAQMLEDMAEQWNSAIDNLLARGQNSTTPIGPQCINEASKRTLDTIQQRINQLQQFITQVKKENQRFEQQNKDLLTSMEDDAAILYGTSQSRGREKKLSETNFAQIVGPACTQVIGNQLLTGTKRQGGLVGLRDVQMQEANIEASKFKSNKNLIEKQIRNQAQAMQKAITEFGPEGLQNELAPYLARDGGEVYPSLLKTFENEQAIFKNEVKRIRNSLQKEIGWTLPQMDGNFRYETDIVKQTAIETFTRNAVQRCVANDTNVSVGQILEGLRHNSTNNVGSTIISYKTAFASIMDADSYMEDKLQSLKELDQLFSNKITVTFLNSQGRKARLSPYEIYSDLVGKCRTIVALPTKDGGMSTTQIIERADNYIQQALKMERQFSARLVNQVINEAINCGGRGLQAGQCNASNAGQFMNPSGNMFCVRHASQCSQQIESCYRVVDNAVKQRKGVLERKARQYNANVSALVARQENILRNMKAQVLASATYLQSIIPGVADSFQWPKDLFVPMPEISTNAALGVDLRGGGDLKDMDQLTGRLEELIEAFNGQKLAVRDQLADYEREQDNSIRENKKKWNSLKERCMGRINKYQQFAQQAAGEQQKVYAEAMNFCQKYNMLSVNPAAGCGSVDGLYEEAMKASQFLGGNKQGILLASMEFTAYCNKANNHKERDDDDDDDLLDGEEMLYKYCIKKPSDWKDIVIAYTAKRLRKIDSKAARALRKYIDLKAEGEDPDSPDELDNYQDLVSSVDDLFQLDLDEPDPINLDNLSEEKKELAQETNSKIAEAFESSNTNLCEKYMAVAKAEAYEDFPDGFKDKTTLLSKAKEIVKEGDFSEMEDYVRYGEELVSLDLGAVTSNGVAIGELMQATPCLSQQGFNAANRGVGEDQGTDFGANRNIGSSQRYYGL